MIRTQTASFKQKIKFVALLTALIFTSQDVLWADGGNFVQSIGQKQQIGMNVPAGMEWATERNLNAVHLPESIGQITKNFQGSRDRIVIHVQDAHANEEAQRNIAAILDFFAEHHSLKVINLEGAEGELFTDFFSFFPDKEAKRNIADFFLKEARLTGPEYLAIVDRPDLYLYGVEDKKLYEENRAAYLEAMEFKERDVEILAGIEKVLEGISRFVFSEELRQLLRYRQSFNDGGKELVAYVRHLMMMAKESNIALYDYPGLHSLLSLVDLEKEINFDSAEEQIGAFMDDLKKTLSRDKLSRFLTNTVQFRMKKMKRADYYGYLQEEIDGSQGDEELTKKYEDVLAYLKYMRLYDAIDVDIFEEIEGLEKNIKNKLFRSETEVTLDRLYKIYEIYKKMIDFTLTKQDADFFYSYRDEFTAETFVRFLSPLLKQYQFSYGLPSRLEILDQDLSRIERFYEAALKRDNVLITRAVAEMESHNEKIMAVVTGGFHTPGIEAYLKENDYSYLVIAPTISSEIDHEKETQLYKDALQEKPLPFETRLVQAMFPIQQANLNDPRFQLSAWKMVMNTSPEFLNTFNLGLEAAKNGNLTDFINQDPRFANAFFMVSLTIVESIMNSDNPTQAITLMKDRVGNFPEAYRGGVLAMIQRFEQGVLEVQGENRTLYLQGSKQDQMDVFARFLKGEESETCETI
jgi:hypothetical protein